ncbi:MAG: phosphonate ABC transporter ATP-binding protein [Lautropia sp.]
MIRLERVGVAFAGLQALHPTSLTFRDGEFTVLLGASGAGKSTLLRCLNLLNRPSEGRVVASDLGDIADRRTLQEHRRRTAFVFQQHQLIGHNTALANVLVGRLGYHSAWRTLFPLPHAERRVALESLARVDLLHKALERVDRLSGGQQQRVGIARALAQGPRLLLADEPVASLDPATADRVLALLRRICDEDRIAAVVSLHQLDLARVYADRIVGLAHGRVVFDGPPGALGDVALTAIYGARRGDTLTEPIGAPHPFTPTYATAED